MNAVVREVVVAVWSDIEMEISHSREAPELCCWSREGANLESLMYTPAQSIWGIGARRGWTVASLVP